MIGVDVRGFEQVAMYVLGAGVLVAMFGWVVGLSESASLLFGAGLVALAVLLLPLQALLTPTPDRIVSGSGIIALAAAMLGYLPPLVGLLGLVCIGIGGRMRTSRAGSLF